MVLTCKNPDCSKRFKGRPDRKYCSRACFVEAMKGRQGNKGSFKKGHRGWMKGKKGIHVSPETEFKNGHTVSNAPIGAIHFWKKKKSKLPRRHIKIAKDEWKLLSVYTWEQHYGHVPKGYVVWFKDNEPFNDRDIDNLELMTKSECMKRIKAGDKKNGLNGSGKEVEDEPFDPHCIFI